MNPKKEEIQEKGEKPKKNKKEKKKGKTTHSTSITNTIVSGGTNSFNSSTSISNLSQLASVKSKKNKKSVPEEGDFLFGDIPLRKNQEGIFFFTDSSWAIYLTQNGLTNYFLYENLNESGERWRFIGNVNEIKGEKSEQNKKKKK